MRRWAFVSYAKSIENLFVKPLVLLAMAAATICVVVLFVPFMPESGLDPSWKLALNYEVSKNISIGKDAIFTFGPFASIFTMQYYPSTDRLMMLGACWLALSYIAVLLPIVQRSTLIGIGILYLLPTFMLTRDCIFDAYCLLYVIACWDLSERPRLSSAWLAPIALAASALALIAETKLSFLIPSLAAWLAGALLLAQRKDGARAAIVAATVPLLSLLISWLAVGQPLFGLYFYFKNAVPVIAGYTDALSSPGDLKDIIVYVPAAIVILVSVLSGRFESVLSGLLVFCMFALFLFLGVKAGFVRHDGHALAAGSMIFVAGVCLGLTRPRISSLAGAGMAFVAFLAIDYGYTHTIQGLLTDLPESLFAEASQSLRERLNGESLPRRFDQAMATIRDEAPLPILPGTSDIYPYDLADLIASGNTWQPRPVIQSYQAYGALLSAEADHLRGSKAPTNIFFRIQPLDGHFPLMESGPAIPEILARYAARTFEGNTLVLVRRDPKEQTSPELTTIGPSREATFGQTVEVPQSEGSVFAVFSFDRSRTSSLVSLAFKAPRLSITVTLADGSERQFRVIIGMIEQGFILSPLVENVDEFAKLFANDRLAKKSVKSFMIDQEDGLGRLPGRYHVAFYRLTLNNLSSSIRPEQFENRSPTGVAPAMRSCVDSLDLLNGKPAAKTNRLDGSLQANGWLAIDTANGILPQATYVTLKDKSGNLFYLRAKPNSRQDVALYFHVPKLIRSGFAASASTSNIPSGTYTLGLAATYNGTLYSCSDFSASVDLK